MTAISDRGLDQSDAGRAIEIWRQTLLEPLTGVTVPDANWLVKFHGGTVDILQEPPLETYVWPQSYGCAVWPVSVDESDLKIGASESPLAIATAFYYKERSTGRNPTEAGLEDLAWYFRAASLSQNTLVWKGTWSEDPPAGSTINKGGAGMAVRMARIFPADFGRFFDERDDCGGVEAFFTNAWIQRIQTC